MSVSAAMAEIESRNFSARMSVATDTGMFLKILEHDRTVNDLLEELGHIGQARSLVHRVFALLTERVDVRFRNPHDVAIAVFLWALTRRQEEYGKIAAQTAEDLCVRYWWTPKITKLIASGALSGETRKIEGPVHLLTFSLKLPINYPLQRPDLHSPWAQATGNCVFANISSAIGASPLDPYLEVQEVWLNFNVGLPVMKGGFWMDPRNVDSGQSENIKIAGELAWNVKNPESQTIGIHD